MEQSFYEQVHEIVRLIPKGRVTSYVAIARSLGAAKSSRMVGYAMNNAHGVHPPVPAHRVVNAKGLLTGRFHFTPPELMQLLLENEGLTIENDQVKNFKIYFWDPAVEL
ncbi:MGMT family protein [Pedobacter hartonius]|uniref:Methylated-DNA-protein-cysteine methyltransferase related protein n=1 Tax=Pedobacter hartonius TaxID=425514 RepID=A0A1H4FED6_9SPHI|nr:MGMT family protein [Pedobacter hartonius]SEA95719.1 methylated-DNA-protein-cysteine methyltransferase related protein [Pedobacter hartonius]